MLISFFFCYGNKRRSTKIQARLNALDRGLNKLGLYYIPECNELKTQTFGPSEVRAASGVNLGRPLLLVFFSYISFMNTPQY